MPDNPFADLIPQQPVSASSREPSGDIQGQIGAMLDPNTTKDAVFLAPSNAGDVPADLPGAVQRITRPEGTLLTTNKDKAQRFKGPKALSDDDMASILGYPVTKADASASGNPIVVQGRDADGNVVSEAATSPLGYNVTHQAISSQTPKGGNVTATTPEDVQARRDATVNNPFADLIPAPHERSAASKALGVAGQAGSGAWSGIADVLGLPVDVAAKAFGVIRGKNINDPFLGSENIKEILGHLGLGPKAYAAPQGFAEKTAFNAGRIVPDIAATFAAREPIGAVGEGLASAADTVPYLGKAVGYLTRLASNVSTGSLGTDIAIGEGANLGSSVAQEVAPEKWQPYASIAGGLVGAAGAGAAVPLAKAGVQALQDIFPVTRGIRERQAAETFRRAATNPEAVEAELNNPPEPPFPGASPTTAASLQTPDAGLDELERRMRVYNAQGAVDENGNPVSFAGKAAQQNAARVEALRDVRPPSADPADVRRYVTEHLNQIDALSDQAQIAAKEKVQEALENAQGGIGTLQGATAAKQEAALSQARQGVTGATEALGGLQTPYDYGAQLRDTVLAPARQASSLLQQHAWAPLHEANPIIDLSPAAQFAKQLQASTPPGAFKAPGEDALIGRIASLDQPVPFETMRNLSSNLGQAISDLAVGMRTNPGASREPLYRLGQLRRSLNDAIGSAAERSATLEQAQGIAPENSLYARLQQQAQEFLDAKYGEQPQTRGNIVLDNEGMVPAAASGVSTGRGGPRPPIGGPPGAAGSEGAAEDAAKLVTWNADFADQYKAAKAVSAQHKGTWDSGNVGKALKTNGYGDFTVPNEHVITSFLNEGPKKASDFQEFLDAVGNRQDAMQIAQDYTASQIRSAAVNPDGTLNPTKLQGVLKRIGNRMDAFPELQGKITDAKTAQQFLDDQIEAHAGKQGLVSDIAKGLMNATNPDGTFNRATYARWAQRNADRLDAHPDIKGLFDTADAAQTTLEAAQLQAKANRREFEKSAAGAFLNTSDPAETIGTILNSKGSKGRVSDLMNSVRNAGDDGSALNGLQAATVNHVLNSFATKGPSVGGEPLISGANLRNFLNSKQDQLTEILGPDGYGRLKAISNDIENQAAVLERNRLARESTTAQNLASAKKGEPQSLLTYVMNQVYDKLPLVAAVHGHVLGAAGVAAAQWTRAVGEAERNAIITRMVIDPEYARLMLTKFPANPSPGAIAAIKKRLGAMTTTSGLAALNAQEGQGNVR